MKQSQDGDPRGSEDTGAQVREKSISAMLRVKDEGQFLYAAVRSVIDCVDEVVLVDNMSTDETPRTIERLGSEFPGRIRSYAYPFEIRRVGREHSELATSTEGTSSPHLSSNYYNWCLARCSCDYTLKWDGDMIALPTFHDALAAWRKSQDEVMVVHGANVHRNLKNLMQAKSAERQPFLEASDTSSFPLWALSLTYDYPEPRLFPRRVASYDSHLGWTQCLDIPKAVERLAHRVESPCFLHMKFCKRDPFSNYTKELAAAIAANIDVGPPLPEGWRQILEEWGIA